MKRVFFLNEESQAPSTNKLEKITLQKQSQPNLERIFKNKRIASNAPKQIWKEYSSKTQNRRHRPLGKKMEGALLQNKESQAPSPKKLEKHLQKQGIASTVPRQIRTESSAKTKNRKHRPQTNSK